MYIKKLKIIRCILKKHNLRNSSTVLKPCCLSDPSLLTACSRPYRGFEACFTIQSTNSNRAMSYFIEKFIENPLELGEPLEVRDHSPFNKSNGLWSEVETFHTPRKKSLDASLRNRSLNRRRQKWHEDGGS